MGKFNLVDLLNGAGEQAEQQEAARAEARPKGISNPLMKSKN